MAAPSAPTPRPTLKLKPILETPKLESELLDEEFLLDGVPENNEEISVQSSGVWVGVVGEEFGDGSSFRGVSDDETMVDEKMAAKSAMLMHKQDSRTM